MQKLWPWRMNIDMSAVPPMSMLFLELMLKYYCIKKKTIGSSWRYEGGNSRVTFYVLGFIRGSNIQVYVIARFLFPGFGNKSVCSFKGLSLSRGSHISLIMFDEVLLKRCLQLRLSRWLNKLFVSISIIENDIKTTSNILKRPYV